MGTVTFIAMAMVVNRTKNWRMIRGVDALAGSKNCGRRIQKYNGSLQYVQGDQPRDRKAVKSVREVDGSSGIEMKFRCLAKLYAREVG